MSRVRLAIFFGVIAVALLSAVPGEAAFPGKNGKIAYYTSRISAPGDGHDVFAVNADGTGDTQITSSEGNDFEGIWSADGTKLLFQSDRHNFGGRRYDLYTINADGTGEARLTNFATATTGFVRSAENPTWGTAGSPIAFDIGQEFGNAQAFIVNADGTGLDNLLPDSFFEMAPAWSPTSDLIAVPAAFGEDSGIYTVRPDGSDVKLVVPGQWNFPDWSPDGSKLAFGGFGNNSEIFVANADGSGLKQISPDNGIGEGSPVWSPDGTKLAFRRFIDPHLYVMDADGSNIQKVVDAQVPATPSSWQPIPAPERADFKNSNEFCRAEQTFWGDRFTGRYGGGANAFGKCISQKR